GRLRRSSKVVVDLETAERVVYGLLARRKALHRRPTPCQYCGWCKHALTCSAIGSNIEGLVAAREDWGLKITEAHISRLLSDPTAMGLARYLWKSQIEPWGKHVDFASRSMADGGVVPLGYKKSVVRGSPEVTDAIGAGAALMAAGVPKDAIEPLYSLSFGALVDAYRTSMGVTKDAAEMKVEELLTAAGKMTRAEAGFMLRAIKGAPELLASAIARPVLPIEKLEHATSGSTQE
ncbi:MAG TPA: hypothetical protein VHF69_04095, partial [Candidatus Synoicihabitans sp.]|nr:hypothetical protein [Candidatus Synoicihabitans sp.]